MILPPRSWPELVFHVLAHVRESAHLPSSVYDSVYVRYAEGYAGPATERTLAEDSAMLGSALSDHEVLARAQLVALLFEDALDAQMQAERDLPDLGALSPRHRGLCTALAPIARAAELLRCAALLEKESVDLLPPVAVQPAEIISAMDQVTPAAPSLERHHVLPIRSLRLRGRLMGDEIWIGAPSDDLALAPSHVAWQAGHEATVGEVGKAARGVSERELEHVAVILMAERARAAGLGAEHAGWLSHLAAPELDRRALSSAGVALLEGLS